MNGSTLKNLNEIISESKDLYSLENLKTVFGFIDLTTLKPTDTEQEVTGICKKVNSFSDTFPDIPNVAAVCAYPALISAISKTLAANGVNIVSAAAGFPDSQTFISIKVAECEMSVAKGANEVDVVISVGKLLAKDHQAVFNEIFLMKKAVGDNILKVILEAGALGSPENISIASNIAMEAGADFIKSSTGRYDPAATPESVYIMAQKIHEYYRKTGRKTGIKPSGGIVSGKQAVEYMAIVKHVLGDEWLTPKLFRIGASKLANNILTEINTLNTGKKEKIVYF